MNLKISSLIAILLLASISYGQIENYQYKREISGISQQWHTIKLPPTIFEHANNSLSDVRILGINEAGDLIEAPYIIEIVKDENILKEKTARLINQSKKTARNYLTLQLASEQTINLIKLDFRQQNFDWLLRLEASHNQQEWFTVLSSYRILSIKNTDTNYKYTKINFEDSKYKYYRISFISIRRPILLSAKTLKIEQNKGEYIKYTNFNSEFSENKIKKQSSIKLKFPGQRSIYSIKLFIDSPFDYYRHYSVYYISDSIETPDGYRYVKREYKSGIISSFEEQKIILNNLIEKEIEIVINNNDNEILKIDSVEIKASLYELTARFTQKANYYLVYGNSEISRPIYDIEQFTHTIPKKLGLISLGEEIHSPLSTTNSNWPYKVDIAWLWVVMGVIIIVLAWFSFNMMNKK